MRTTINLDDDLLATAKRRAADTGRTLTAVIEDAVRQALTPRPGSRRQRTELPAGRSDSYLQPGVDLDDSGALLDLMEQADASR